MAKNVGNWFENAKTVLDKIQNLNVSGAQVGTIVFSASSGTAGATAGWVNTAGYATLPASQTDSDFIIPITVNIGDTIESFKVMGQIDSAGNSVTFDAALWRNVPAVGGTASSSIGAITQVVVTADTLLASEKVLATPEVVASNESYYVYIEGTTAGTTDIEVVSIEVTLA